MPRKQPQRSAANGERQGERSDEEPGFGHAMRIAVWIPKKPILL